MRSLSISMVLLNCYQRQSQHRLCGRCSYFQDVLDADKQSDDADSLHCGPVHPFGEIRAREGADTASGEHGEDVNSGSDTHGSPQYCRNAAGESLYNHRRHGGLSGSL